MNLKGKKIRLTDDINTLETSADKFALKAESTGNLTLIVKSNSLRKGPKDKNTNS